MLPHTPPPMKRMHPTVHVEGCSGSLRVQPSKASRSLRLHASTRPAAESSRPARPSHRHHMHSTCTCNRQTCARNARRRWAGQSPTVLHKHTHIHPTPIPGMTPFPTHLRCSVHVHMGVKQSLHNGVVAARHSGQQRCRPVLTQPVINTPTHNTYNTHPHTSHDTTKTTPAHPTPSFACTHTLSQPLAQHTPHRSRTARPDTCHRQQQLR